MVDSLIARICAFGLAGIVTLSIVTGINALAANEHAEAVAESQQDTMNVVAASAPSAERL